MGCSIAAAIVVGALAGTCPQETSPILQPVDPPLTEIEELPDDQPSTAGGVAATVPRMDDRFGHDDRFGYDVPHRDRSRRQR
jgi:hypothetical protein